MMARPKKIIPNNIEVAPAIETAFLSPVTDTPPSEYELPVGADKIGNQLQKEVAAYKGGLTRAKVVEAINKLLNATNRVSIGYNSVTGEEVFEETPDKLAIAKGAELAGKYFGDFKEREVVGNVTHNKIVYQWLSAPNAAIVGNRV